MAITDTDAWHAAVAADLARRNEIAASVEQSLTPDDVAALAAIAGTGTMTERDVALRFLARLVRGQPARIQHARERLIDSLQRTVTNHYFNLPLGSIAWNLLRHLSGREANAILLAAAPVQGRSDDELRHLLQDLSLLSPSSTPEVAARLAEIAQLPLPVAAEAQARIESAGLLPAEAIDLIASEWRERRDRRSLNRLYNASIIHQRAGTSAASTLKLLGPPTLRDGSDYRWDTNEPHPIQLMILVDKQGCIESSAIR